MPIEPVPGRRTFVKHVAVGLAPDSRDIDFSRLRSTKAVSGEVVIRAERVENVSITSGAAPEGSRALVEIRGAGSQEIVLALNRVPKGVAESAFAHSASASVVEKRA